MKKIFILLMIILPMAGYAQNGKITEFADRLRLRDARSGASSSVRFDQQSLSVVSRGTITRNVRGCRICVFFDGQQDARDKGTAVLENIRKKYPHLESDISYEGFEYRVYLGYFQSRAEAGYVLTSLNYYYPKAFVREENFDISKLAKRIAITPPEATTTIDSTMGAQIREVEAEMPASSR